MDRRTGRITLATLPDIRAFAQRRQFIEEFLSASSATAPAAGASISFTQPWWWIGGVPMVTTGGFSAAMTAQVISDGTRNGQAYNNQGDARQAFQFNPAARLGVLHMRIGQVGTAAGTRRIGFAAEPLTGSPTNGIFISFSNAGNYTLNCISATTSTTVDSGIAAANGVFRYISLLCSTTKVDLYVDSVYKGSVTTNIPNTAMGITIGHSVTTNGEGLTLGAIKYEEDRP